MDGDLFAVITGHLRHKTLEPMAIFSWALVKAERLGQFQAMLDFLGLREFFMEPCKCKGMVSHYPQSSCHSCGKASGGVYHQSNTGHFLCDACHLSKCPSRKR